MCRRARTSRAAPRCPRSVLASVGRSVPPRISNSSAAPPPRCRVRDRRAISRPWRLEQLVLAAEHLADRIVDEYPPDRIGQELGARKHTNVFRTVETDRNGVRDDDLLQ